MNDRSFLLGLCISIVGMLFPFALIQGQILEIQYKIVVVPKSEFGRWKPNPQQQREIMNKMEEINRNNYSYFTLTTDGRNSMYKHDTTYSTSEKKEEKSFWFGSNLAHGVTYKDFEHKTVYTVSPKEFQKQICKSEPFIERKQWLIGNEKKVFSDMLCQAAYYVKEKEDTIKAWFTPKIPISDGPDNYCGLPGLILAVEGKDLHYVAEKINVRNRDSTSHVSPEQYMSTDCYTSKDYDDEIRKLSLEYYLKSNN